MSNGNPSTNPSGGVSVSASEGGRRLRVMSGVRATGKLHIGHYWGVLRTWPDLQEEYDCFFGVMDWHGMTTAYKTTEEIAPWVLEMYAEFIAWGVNPEKCTLFVQSMIPEHLELFMIFANLTPMGWLERVPSWKDAEEEAKANDTHNLGRFAYPVLQAADIAIYGGQKVPVGADQVSHLELSREIIRRFNRLYKGKLKEPAPLMTETPLVGGLDGRKMSKSYNNTLLLTEESEKALKKRVNSMVTDPQRALRENPGHPEVCSVFGYHKLYSTEADREWVVQGCTTAGIGCGDCKGRLATNIDNISAEPREKKKELLSNRSGLSSIIAESNARARTEAQKTLREVRRWMKWSMEGNG